MHIIPVLVGLVALSALAGWGQAPTGPTPAPGRFSIGFLREGSDFENGPVLMAELSRYLLAQQAVRAALDRAGFGEIVPSPCDGPRDMVQRMDQGEFALVFATAVVYARQNGPYDNPILQTRRPGDFKLPGMETGVLRRGVVFMGPGCPLFGSPDLSKDAKREILAKWNLAVPSADSVAGYIYPRLQMTQDYGLEEPAGFWFCDSDAEVVKHVVSGLVNIGACREGALKALLPRPPEGTDPAAHYARYYQALFETRHFPTDPILLRNEFFPSQSDLGRELKAALREFFNLAQKIDPELNVENASKRDYEDLQNALNQLDGTRRAGGREPAPNLPVEAIPETPPAELKPALPNSSLLIPHSPSPIPHSALRIPHSTLGVRNP